MGVQALSLLKNIPLSMRIIFSMILGLFIGSILSTVHSSINSIANAFVMLLQMTALPYIALSLIIGIAGLSPLKAKQTFKQSLFILVALILVVLFFILLVPIAFPDWQSANFYSASTIKPSQEFDLIKLFIPTNPFYALSNGLIPAIVLFCIFFGIGLMHVKDKKRTLLILNSFNIAIVNINTMVMKFAPIGIFCIALRATATVNSAQIDGLLIYITTCLSLVFLLSFVILPAIVATITPFHYREIIKASREAMLTAFATGSFIVVIPLMVEKTKILIKQLATNSSESLTKNTLQNSDVESVPNIIIPISFSLPIGGKLLALLFTLFAAWFSGTKIDISNYFNLLLVGLPQLFGSSTIAMPNLLDLFNVPSSMFDLFLVAENIIVGRLGALLSVVFTIVLTLLIATALLKQITFKWLTFSRHLLLLPIISIVIFLTLRFSFQGISHQYQGYATFIDRDFILLDTKNKVLDKPQKNDALSAHPYTDVLKRIQQRGFIRVGYFRDDLPYSFHNKQGKLVGFDIEIINFLADDLNVSIEFVKIFHEEAQDLLSSGYLDMTTGIPVQPENMKKYTLTVPYSKQPFAFIVKKERRNEFTDWREILTKENLVIGIPEMFYSENIVKRYFNLNKAWKISTPRLFFKEEFKHIDGMLLGAATASAWSLLHPNYTVVMPKPIRAPFSMAFAINKNDSRFELFMRNWLTMKKQSGTIDQLFSYWIEGRKSTKINNQILLEEANK